MKTVTRNISLPEELDRFAQSQAETKGFSTISAYFQDLVRQQRQAQIEEDVRLLDKASKGAPAEEPGDEFFRKASTAQRKYWRGKAREAA